MAALIIIKDKPKLTYVTEGRQIVLGFTGFVFTLVLFTAWAYDYSAGKAVSTGSAVFTWCGVPIAIYTWLLLTAPEYTRGRG